MRNGKMGAYAQQRMERCSVPTAKSLKKSRNKFISGCESMRIENVRSHEARDAHQ